ncbi:hypothetical protein GUITHDRAFT_154646, partial [Guillardia theta CCMP2712]
MGLTLLLLVALSWAFVLLNLGLIVNISTTVAEGFGWELMATTLLSAVLLTLLDGIIFDTNDCFFGERHQIDTRPPQKMNLLAV